jgi:hypothetical protein
MRFISLVLKVGLIVLQQLAQDKQSVSCHTSLSALTASSSSKRGGSFSSLVRKALNPFWYNFTFCLKDFRFMGCINCFNIENRK